MPSNSSPSPSGYFGTFAALFERIEVTDRGGRRLGIDEGIQAAIDLVTSLHPNRGKAMVIGNGGSAAIASHLHNDLCKTVGVRAMAFTELPLLTALANDDGYHTVFRQPAQMWSDRGDLMIAVSSSGESENIVQAAALAVDKGCGLLTMTGFKPANRLRQLGDVNVYVPSDQYGYVEMAHSVIGHCVTDMAIARLAARI